MRKLFIVVIGISAIIGGSALADYVYRDANNALQTFFAFTCQVSKNCSAQVLIDSTGTEKATAGNPLSTLDANSAATLTAIQGSVPAGTNVIGGVFGANNVTPANCSGTITTGGAAQNAITANAALHGFTIANIDPTAGGGEALWISFTGAAAVGATGSYPLSAPTATTFAGLSSYTTPVGFGTNANVSVISATTGHQFSCVRW